MDLINLDHSVFQVATQVGKESAKWQIQQKLVHQRIVQLKNCQDYDASGIFDHCFTVVEEFAGYS